MSHCSVGFSLAAFLSLVLHWYSAITPVHPSQGSSAATWRVMLSFLMPIGFAAARCDSIPTEKRGGKKKKNCLSTKLSQLAGVGSAIKDSDFQCDSYCTRSLSGMIG